MLRVCLGGLRGRQTVDEVPATRMDSSDIQFIYQPEDEDVAQLQLYRVDLYLGLVRI